jgi:hypothetical protein
MTAQATDTFIYKRNEYDLIGLKGNGLFSPEQFGMISEMLDTGCYRGFIAKYKIVRKQLYLQELTLREANGNYLGINVIYPEKQFVNELMKMIDDQYENDRPDEVYTATYRDLKLSCPFTGKLRVARGFIKEFYIHMGYQKPTAYQTVYDFILINGKVLKVTDRSAKMEQKRGSFKSRYKANYSIDAIDAAFSLDMDLE